MAEALTGILDRVVALMQGESSGVDRSIATGQFKHYEQPIEDSRQQTAKKPYPFNLMSEGWDPGALEIQSNVSGNYRIDAHVFSIRVGYSHRYHDHYKRRKQIEQDYYKIRRTLTDPQAYSSGATGFCGMSIKGEPTITTERIGSDTQVELMDLLTIPLELIYREDHSS